MNNEPVAWMREDGVIAFHKQKEVDSQGYKWQPLYTHSVKELTDEEYEKLKEVNAKQVDYISEQKSAYEKLWKEHMELFWKHEQDKDLTNE